MSLDMTARRPTRIGEARRQVEICNACRYCEGYCAVFPAMYAAARSSPTATSRSSPTSATTAAAATTPASTPQPHEFALNLPRALAEVRARKLGALRLARRARRRRSSGAASALGRGAGRWAWRSCSWRIARASPAGGGAGFYAYLSHGAMVAIFAPAFLFPLARHRHRPAPLLARGRRRAGALADLRDATRSPRRLDCATCPAGRGRAATSRRATATRMARRHAHQAVIWGFLLCFAATTSGTVLHYGFGMEAPYGLLSLPKLLGVPGGMLLVARRAGCSLAEDEGRPRARRAGPLGRRDGLRPAARARRG